MLDFFKYFLFKKRRQKFVDKMYKTEDPWSSVLHLNAVRGFLQHRLRRKYRLVLDAGCGEGVFAEDLRAFADEYLGVDISSAAVARAEKAHSGERIEFRRVDVFALDLSKNKPDLVVFNFVLDYLGFQKFPKSFSAELYSFLQRNLAPDADIVIINPVYSEKNSADLAKYFYLFKNFGWELSASATTKFQGYELTLALLKPNKVEPHRSGVQ